MFSEKNRLLGKALYSYSMSKSLIYSAQYLLMNQIASFMPQLKNATVKLDAELIRQIRTEVKKIIEEDVKNIQNGQYPISVLFPSSFTKNFKIFPKVVVDSLKVGKRRAKGEVNHFSSQADPYLSDVPDYYKKNFHYQTDGYLSSASAEVYEYQVELLFSGTSDIMRRLIIPPMKEHFREKKAGNLKILEIGAGTGTTTRFVKLAFPNARIVVTDLSEPYLNEAKQNLSNFRKIDFLQADGARLPFRDEEFDAVYSVFLFHELPDAVRQEVLLESERVLKKGGFLGFVDSIQENDFRPFNEVLESFPKNFYEPYFRSYLKTPMQNYFQKLPVSNYQSKVGLFSKVGSAVKD